jgi:hypothetical protein
MTREGHVRFCESVGVRFPRATRPYLKVKGRWTYLYRAIDRGGQPCRCLAERDTGQGSGGRILSPRTHGYW